MPSSSSQDYVHFGGKITFQNSLANKHYCHTYKKGGQQFNSIFQLAS